MAEQADAIIIASLDLQTRDSVAAAQEDAGEGIAPVADGRPGRSAQVDVLRQPEPGVLIADARVDAAGQGL